MTVYDFSAPLLNGEPAPLSQWRGRVLLIVNTASHCGFTPQYAGLQRLHEKLEPQGLTVLGFPSNQFLNQEFGSESEITRFCRENLASPFRCFPG
jgi:glutathione peroxidase